ncbi:MAG: hypothetical protein ABI678_22085, partial [Kofleriaceae bacterium]
MRFLFCVADAIGVAHQLLAIGRELAATGHEVAYVANNSLASLFRELDVRHVPPPTRTESFLIREWAGTRSTVLQFAHVDAAIRELRPDAIVTSPFGYGPVFAAHVRGIPLVMAAGISFLWTAGSLATRQVRDNLEAGARMLGVALPSEPIERLYF